MKPTASLVNSSILFLFFYGLLLLPSCKKGDGICGGEVKYSTFTREELRYMAINVDLAMKYQEELKATKSHPSPYHEYQEMFFEDATGKTIKFYQNNSLIPGQKACTSYPLRGTSLLNNIDSSFVKTTEVVLYRSFPNSDFQKTVSLQLTDRAYSFPFVTNDTNTIIYKWEKDQNDTLKDFGFITEGTLELDNQNFNCYIFQVFNEQKIKTLEVFFSNQHGFLKIIKDEKEELTRVF